MNKIILSLVLFLISQSLFSYTPTVESLFRGGANPDLKNNLIAMEFYLKGEDNKDYHIKYLIFSSKEGDLKALELFYDGEIETNNLKGLIHWNRFKFKEMGLDKKSLDKGMYYAMLASIFGNSGRMIIDLLQSYGEPFKRNIEIINQDHLSVISNYKYYLKVKDQDEEAKNPLVPETVEEKERIADVFSSPFYEKSQFLKRVNYNNKLYYEVESERFFARFNQSGHVLERINFRNDDGETSMDFRNYLAFHGNRKYPESFYIQTQVGESYRLRLKKVSILNETPEGFIRRVENYRKDYDRNTVIPDQINRPLFLY